MKISEKENLKLNKFIRINKMIVFFLLKILKINSVKKKMKKF